MVLFLIVYSKAYLALIRPLDLETQNTKHKHGSTVRVKIYIKLRAVVHNWNFDLSAEI